jgi:4-hydroxybenzoate polyprenyltransferase
MTRLLSLVLTDVPVGMGLFGASVTLGLYGWLGVPAHAAWVAASGLLLFALYGVNRLTDLREDTLTQPERARVVRRSLVPLSGLFAAAGLAAVGLSASAGVKLSWLAPVLLAVPVYSARWLPGGRRLKDVTLAKNVFVAAVTVYGTAGVASLLLGPRAGVGGYLVFAAGRVTLNNVLCDVPDADGDRTLGVMTLPARYGAVATLVGLRWSNLLLAAVGVALAGSTPLVLGSAVAGELVLRAALAGRLRGPTLKTVADLEVAAWPVYLLLG